MSNWESYPRDYRRKEVETLLGAARAGECAAVIGLSGAGKSNLFGFMAHRVNGNPPLALVDCNRLAAPMLGDFYSLVGRSLGHKTLVGDPLGALEEILGAQLSPAGARLCLLFDRFDALDSVLAPFVYGSLRALRDAHKYRLTFLIAARQPPDPNNELAELFIAHTLWLGPLSLEDARWSAESTLARAGLELSPEETARLIEFSWGYPALLRACCQAYAEGCELKLAVLRQHPAVAGRVEEFWASMPTLEALRKSGLEGQPLLAGAGSVHVEPAALTAKEANLLDYLKAHAGEVCDKDDLIRAVWPEDKVFLEGIRDDSLAQLVRRLRRKIEPDPKNPRHLLNITGRGYRFLP
ncbi:MAG: winged helix-turn-helix domain-containing protein [Anaerolineaceae bacterium]|nr:winged helix-turn-helix domain-containing protein [Anaerolineaceae bacterium]